MRLIDVKEMVKKMHDKMEREQKQKTTLEQSKDGRSEKEG